MTQRYVRCSQCEDKGYVETGNNDLPCKWCPAGQTVLINDAGVDGGAVTGAELMQHFLNNSPQPIQERIDVSRIPGRGVTFYCLGCERVRMLSDRSHVQDYCILCEPSFWTRVKGVMRGLFT